MTIGYGPDEEIFTYSAFLVLNNRIFVCLVSLAVLLYRGESVRNVAPIKKYFYISFSNTAATLCQYEALKWISFPTQTLGKCGKMIPVMLVSTFIGLKKYVMQDYFVALSITAGCTMFVLTGDVSSKASSDKDDSVYGLLLMVGYLFLDGFTSTFQEKLFKDYKISSFNQMLYVNLCSGIISLLLLVFTGALMPALEFVMKYPEAYLAVICLSAAACCGQIVIYYIIKNFGALVFSTVMVTRNVISIFISCVFFGHGLTYLQMFAAVIVLGSFYYSKVSKKKSTPATPTPSAPAMSAVVVDQQPDVPGK
eukprot:CAMPEP_0177642976 /NCGR_PEP_ID=MMETSP0447-20121125/7907_1 /TAXON_ID=0 /ORGANISM="Stygamoeba regulata, Strain BSH-02190019" /LENGTH=308 /DNA_ID=CAMNT_0019145237 /DNA_START=193 /DNA_END=1119 /DNA_ORIENTATION=-